MEAKKVLEPKKSDSQENPKPHDYLFKWLISAFTKDFFEHYFPDINMTIGPDPFLDKEFISKYEALKASLFGDLFLIPQVEINGELFPIVIHIELERKRGDMSERVYEYHCYAWLLKKRPVWSIVVYTDDAVWKQDVKDEFWYGFNSKNQKQIHRFDVIKIKKEKSADLINKKSLLCKLLALKANDKGIVREDIIRGIYETVSQMRDQLNADILLLVDQFVDFYKKIPEKTFKTIKEESMQFVPMTIGEYYRHEGEIKGKIDGVIEGEIKGEIKGKIGLLKSLYDQNILTKAQYNYRLKPLKEEWLKIQASQTGSQVSSNVAFAM